MFKKSIVPFLSHPLGNVPVWTSRVAAYPNVQFGWFKVMRVSPKTSTISRLIMLVYTWIQRTQRLVA